jgi:TonB family protein
MSVVCISEADGQQLNAAANQVNLTASGSKPFELRADFTAQVKVPMSGHLVWKWASRDSWSQEVMLGDYSEIRVRKGDRLYIKRNAYFTPLRISELQHLVPVLENDTDYWEVKKSKHKVEGGLEQDCLEIRARDGSKVWNPHRTVCVSSGGEVNSDETRDDVELRKKEFLNYQSFGGHRYPRQLRLLVNGSLALGVEVTTLREIDVTQESFLLPAGAIERRQCDHMVVPKPISTPEPNYPLSAKQNLIQGTVTVAVTVQPDGSVSDVHLLGTAEHEMDAVTQEIVKTWKFKPAMCGSEPVAYDIQVDMNFRLR